MRIILSLFFTCSLFGKLGSQEIDKPNVLLIAVDDLNDWIGCLSGIMSLYQPWGRTTMPSGTGVGATSATQTVVRNSTIIKKIQMNGKI